MISAEVSHQLARLVQTLSFEDANLLRRDYGKAREDKDLQKWLDMPIPTGPIKILIK